MYFTGEESGLMREEYLFELQDVVERREVMACSPEEKAQMPSMSYPTSTCDDMSNPELIDDGAILEGSEQELLV